jgi:rhodanese-related sulfurtransferase
MERFAAGHVPGSLSIALRPQFAVWLGWLVGRHRDVVLVADDETDLDRAVAEARGVGVERLVDVLDVADWSAAGRPLAELPLRTAETAAGAARRPLDVRQTAEHEATAVPGAVHVELGVLADTPPGDEPLIAHCGHGERAVTGASLLARDGYDVAAFAGSPDELTAALDAPASPA